MATDSPAKRKFGDVSIVTLIVGKSKTIFYVHQDLLFGVSPVFQKAFASSFKEGTDRSMSLVHDDVDVVNYFCNWLYKQNIKLSDLCELGDGMDMEGLNTVRLYAFADKFEIITLKNKICKLLQDRLRDDAEFYVGHNSPPRVAVDYAYEHTAPGCKLRRLLADFYAWEVDPKYFAEPDVEEWLLKSETELSVDICLAFARRASTFQRTRPTGGRSVNTFYAGSSPFILGGNSDVYCEPEKPAS